MKIVKFYFILLISILVIFDSCKKEDSAAVLATQKTELSKKALETNINNTINDLSLLKDGKTLLGFTSMQSLIKSETPFSTNDFNLVNLFGRMTAIVNNPTSPSNLGNSSNSYKGAGSFLFTEEKGEYNWNVETKQWIKTNSNMIVLKYPSTPNGTVNDAVFTIYEYEEFLLPNSEFQIGLPSKFKVDLSIAGVVQMGFEFSATYSATGALTMMSETLLLNPFTITMSLINTPTKIETAVSILKNGIINILSTKVSVNGDFKSPASLESMMFLGESIDMSTQVGEIKFSSSINFKKMMSSETKNPTLAQINELYNFKLVWAKDDSKIADCQLEQNMKLMLTFPDNSKVDFATYFDKLKIEGLLPKFK